MANGQNSCFRIYNIPRATRSDYRVVDHSFLGYLNIIEKINCAYCSYINGLITYVQEIAARTEQHWCPITHARRIRSIHSRYDKFMEYGDAAAYQLDLEKIRNDFEDLKPLEKLKASGSRAMP